MVYYLQSGSVHPSIALSDEETDSEEDFDIYVPAAIGELKEEEDAVCFHYNHLYLCSLSVCVS